MSENCCCENCLGCNVFHEYCLDFDGGGWVDGHDNSGNLLCPPTCSDVAGVKIVSWFGKTTAACTWKLTVSTPCARAGHDITTIYVLTLTKTGSTWQWTASINIINLTEVEYYGNYQSSVLSHCKDGFVNNKLSLTKVNEGPSGYMWQQFSIRWCTGNLPATIDIYGKQ
jgi:hypothetical protein